MAASAAHCVLLAWRRSGRRLLRWSLGRRLGGLAVRVWRRSLCGLASRLIRLVADNSLASDNQSLAVVGIIHVTLGVHACPAARSLLAVYCICVVAATSTGPARLACGWLVPACDSFTTSLRRVATETPDIELSWHDLTIALPPLVPYIDFEVVVEGREEFLIRNPTVQSHERLSISERIQAGSRRRSRIATTQTVASMI